MIYLAAILLILMTPGVAVAQEMEWYLSDGAAIQYSATTEQTGLASEWSLSIQKMPGKERIVHYRNSRPVTIWLRSLDSTGLVTREAIEEDGRIVEELLFGPNQLLNLERLFLPDGSVEETRYVRDGDRLISSTQLKNGEETGSRIYLYYPDGRLAGVHEQKEGKTWPTGTERPKSGQTISWTKTSEGLILSIFDTAGRLVGNRMYDGAVLVSTEERIWRDGRLASISTEDSRNGTRLILGYDQAGRLESKLEMKNEKTISLSEFGYDQEDRLIAESREDASGLETTDFVYGSDGALQSETRQRNGYLTLVKTYSEQNEILEEYYDKGKLFARILVKDGRKIRETILSDGKIVRERTF